MGNGQHELIITQLRTSDWLGSIYRAECDDCDFSAEFNVLPKESTLEQELTYLEPLHEARKLFNGIQLCHCGEPTKRQSEAEVDPSVENPGLVLNYCTECCLVRCDAYPGACNGLTVSEH